MTTRIGEDVVTLYRRSRIWWIRYRDNGVRRRESLRTDNRKLAETLRRKKEAELLDAELARRLGVGAPSVGRPEEATPEARPGLRTVREEYEQWSKAHKRPKTVLNDKARLDAFFATVRVERADQVRVADVERFIGKLGGEGKSPATILRHREILHAFFRWAERCGFVDRNPVAGTPRPRLPEREPRFLSLKEIEEMLAAVKHDRVEPVVAVAIFAGLRREELCWLTWDDIRLDAEPPILSVRAKRVGGETWQPKTGRDRKVPISARLRRFLEAQKAERWRRGATWLFESPRGCRWDPDNLSHAVRSCIERAGLRWNFLDMRHTFGSHLARKGVSLVKIAKLMGNSPEIARRHYINLLPEEMAVDVEF